MNLLKTSAILLVLVMASATLPIHAQGISPEDMLKDKPELELEGIPETDLLPGQGTPPSLGEPYQLSRVITCDNSDTVKEYLSYYNQHAWIIGFNRLANARDPFTGIIITRNPLNLAYTVLLLAPNGSACVIATGTEMKPLDEIEVPAQ